MNSKDIFRTIAAVVCMTLGMAAVRAAETKAPAAPKPPEDKTVLPVLSDADVQKIQAALPARAARPQKPHKVLVFWRCDGFFHAPGIAYGNKCLELLGQKTGAFKVDVAREWDALTAANLARYDGLVFNNTTGLDPAPEIKQAILDFINSGKGIIGIHAATDNFPKWPEGQKLMGGRFAGHPWDGGGTWAFKLEEPKHPLCRAFGGKGFKLKDEIYQFKDAYSRDTCRVLIGLDLSDEATAKAESALDAKSGKKKGCREDGDYAVSWIKTVGRGRLFYCVFGHNGSVFQDPAIVQHYLDGIQWALKDTEADATPRK